MDEYAVSEDISDSGDTGECRVLLVHCLQLLTHPEAVGRHRLQGHRGTLLEPVGCHRLQGHRATLLEPVGCHRLQGHRGTLLEPVGCHRLQGHRATLLEPVGCHRLQGYIIGTSGASQTTGVHYWNQRGVTDYRDTGVHYWNLWGVTDYRGTLLEPVGRHRLQGYIIGTSGV